MNLETGVSHNIFSASIAVCLITQALIHYFSSPAVCMSSPVIFRFGYCAEVEGIDYRDFSATFLSQGGRRYLYASETSRTLSSLSGNFIDCPNLRWYANIFRLYR